MQEEPIERAAEAPALDAEAAMRVVLAREGAAILPETEALRGELMLDGETREVWRIRTRAADGGFDRDFLVDARTASLLGARERRLVWEAVGGAGGTEVEATLFAAARSGEQVFPEVQLHFSNEALYFARVTTQDDPLPPGVNLVEERLRDFQGAVVGVRYRLVDLSRDVRISTSVNTKPGLDADALYFGGLQRRIDGSRPLQSAIGLSAFMKLFSTQPADTSPTSFHPEALRAHRNMGGVLDYWSSRFGRGGVESGTDHADIYIATGGLIHGRSNQVSFYDTWFDFGRPDGAVRRSTTSLDDVAWLFAQAVIDAENGPSLDDVQSAAVRMHMANAFAAFTAHAVGDAEGRPAGTDVWRIAESDFSDPLPADVNLDIFSAPAIDCVARFVPNGDPAANAGILNRWLYLWMNGGIHPVSGLQVEGLVSLIGEEKAFRVAELAYYRALTRPGLGETNLRWDSGYRDFRDALIARLPEAFRDAGVEATDEQKLVIDFNVKVAFQAVGLD